MLFSIFKILNTKLDKVQSSELFAKCVLVYYKPKPFLNNFTSY